MLRSIKLLIALGIFLMAWMLSVPCGTLPYPLGKVDLPAIVTHGTPAIQPVTLPLPR